MTVARLKKFPGAIVVPLSQLKATAAVFRGVPTDYQYANYLDNTQNRNPVGWTGCLWAMSGAPSSANTLKITLVSHWEYVAVPTLGTLTKAAHYNPLTIAEQREFDSDESTQTALLPYNLLTSATDFLSDALSSFGRHAGAGLGDYLRSTLLHGSVGSSVADQALYRLALM